ncbi:MAG: dUTP diphosphatase [Holosporales bacterium]|jgi:dUTP pyrophosphatase|nr:dUTP diphosphatase [Holosporales bacterium]
MNIKFIKLNEKAKAPEYTTKHSAGCDLRACITNKVIINPNEITVIGTGILIEIPEEFFGMVCSRSGLAAKNGITILNSPGIIDSDYRGEIKCIMMNYSKTPFVIENGMRIAQLIIVPYKKGIWLETTELQRSDRGTNGLGSTGTY